MSVLPSGTVQLSNLPILTTPFFGRSGEVAEGYRLLRMPVPRLLVLTGTGSAKEVAAHLIISPRTVHAHLASIYGKIGVSTRVAAMHFAIEHGLI